MLGIALPATAQAVHAQLAHTRVAITRPVSVNAFRTLLTGPRIIVAFPNRPEGSPAPAGTTGRRYGGGGSYVVGQRAYAMARRVAKQYDLKEVASWPIKALSVHCVVYEIPDARPVPVVVAELSKDARVFLAEPLQQFHTLTGPPPPPYNDPLYDLQTNLRALGIVRAHLRSMGAGVRIGLVDTGVDTKHPDLRGRIISTRSFIPKAARSPEDYRHGTAMAGVIAAVANNHIGIVGIAPLARLEVLEACWQLKPDADDAACSTFSLAKALASALDAHVQLVNLSLAGPADPLLARLIEAGIRRGMTFVGAAAPPSEGFPARVPGVIIAGSTDHPSWPALLTAPATHVFTLRPEDQYDFESGTSVAAAEVTGVIALLISASHLRLPPARIASLLVHTATPAARQSDGSSPPAVNINGALSELDLEQNHAGKH